MKSLRFVILIAFINFHSNCDSVSKEQIPKKSLDMTIKGVLRPAKSIEIGSFIDVHIQNNYKDIYVFTNNDTTQYYPMIVTWITKSGNKYSGIADYIGTKLYKIQIGEKRDFHFKIDKMADNLDSVVFQFKYYLDTSNFTKFGSSTLVCLVQGDTLRQISQY